MFRNLIFLGKRGKPGEAFCVVRTFKKDVRDVAFLLLHIVV